MANAIKVLFLIVSALFPIVYPLSGSAVFLALTSDYSGATRRELARRVAIDNFFLMLGCYFLGSHILSVFGVSLSVVR